MTFAAAEPEQRSLILGHMPSLDSIRGIAVLMVIFFHGFGGYPWELALDGFWGALASSLVGCGRFGVNVFFVLSGFLITGLLIKAREHNDFFAEFYIKRFLRIVPVYLVVLAILRIWHVIDYRFLAAALLFIANFSKLFGAPLNEYGSLWSLAVEEHFYLIWPTCVRKLCERALARILIVVIIAEPVLRLIAIRVSNHIDIHYKTPFVLDFIAYGALLSLLIRRHHINLDNVARITSTLLIAGATLGVLFVWLFAFHKSPIVDALMDLPFTWGACGLLLLGLQRDHKKLQRTGKTDARGILPFFGYISYGLYLINVLVYVKVSGLMIHHVAPSIRNTFGFLVFSVFLCISISTAVAYLSRRFFEGPMLSLKEQLQDCFANSASRTRPRRLALVSRFR